MKFIDILKRFRQRKTSVGYLVERTQQNDLPAMRELFLIFAPRIFRYYYFLTNSEKHASELVQRLFLRVKKRIKLYKPNRTPFDYWLMRLVVECGRTDLKRGSSRTGEPGRLQYLSPAEREVFILENLLNFRIEEMALILRKKSVAVRVLKHRALKRLSDTLEVDCY